MFNIDIDLSGLAAALDEASFDPLVLQQGLVDAAAFVRDVWVSAVSGNVLPGMNGPVNDGKYASALTTGESLSFPSAFQALVLPYGYTEGADKLETNQSAWDMKPSLLNGPKSRPLKDGSGRYNTIPMRHYTPGSKDGGGSGISIQMRMPDDVYKAAKKMGRSLPGPSGKISWGDSLNWSAPPGVSFTGYQHATNAYQSMYRVGDPGHTQYVTFRRVSTPRTGRNGQPIGSDPRAWWHPAVSANPVTQAVYDYCMPQVERSLFALADKMVG